MNSVSNPEVIVAGHLCLDIIPALRNASFQFVPGSLVESGSATAVTGGAVSNTGLALHRLGISTRLIAKVGDDAFGTLVQRILESEGGQFAEAIVVDPAESTSYSIILSPPGSDRMFIHCPGCNATFDHTDIDYSLLTSARLFHFGYPSVMEHMYRNGGAELTAMYRQAKAAGVTTSLDFGMPDTDGPAGLVDWVSVLTKTLPFVDIFLPSIEELLVAIRPSLYREMALGHVGDIVDQITPSLLSKLSCELLDMGAKIVGIKLGHRGMYLRTGDEESLASVGRAQVNRDTNWANRELWSPCFQVNVVGTTGSGDTTIAGFLMAILRDMSPEEAINAACAVGACSVEAADALGGIRSWPETAARIKSRWDKVVSGAIGDGWLWNDRKQVWHGPSDSHR